MSDIRQFIKKGLINNGTYVADKVYYTNDIVTFEENTYVCLVDKTVGILPTVTTNWELLKGKLKLTTAVSGTGTDPSKFTLSLADGVLTLNKPS